MGGGSEGVWVSAAPEEKAMSFYTGRSATRKDTVFQRYLSQLSLDTPNHFITTL